MIQANKSSFIEWGFRRFNRHFVHFHFENIYVRKTSKSIFKKKTLYLINHSTWWDPLMIYYLNEQLIQSDAFGMMHENGLKRFPFFRKIGAYSVNPDESRHLMDSLTYSIQLLKENKTLWLFPQGEEQHLEKRPLQFQSGAAYLVMKCPWVHVIPVSLYYSLQHTRKPNVYMQIGEEIEQGHFTEMNRNQLTQLFEQVSTLQLDDLRSKVIQEDMTDFTRLQARSKNQ